MIDWSVIGNGVSGLCAATVLAEMGATVEVLTSDEHETASCLAGGMLAPECERECMPSDHATLAYEGFNAIDWWEAHTHQVIRHGSLVLAAARDRAALTRFAERTHGHQLVTPADIEPGLEARHRQGLFYEQEAHLDPLQALLELERRLKANGVVFRQGKPRGEIVDCRGIAAQDQLPDLRAVRGEMLELQSHDIQFSRPVRLLHPRTPCYIVPRGKGRFMVGATMLESNSTAPISARALMELISAACAVHPAFAEAALLHAGAGLRPAFPSNLPEVRYQNNRFYINGMFRHGFILAPLMAQQLAAKIQSGESAYASVH